MFKHARLKLKRADQHIADFKEIKAAFEKTQFYALHIQPDGKSGNQVLQFELVTPVPDELPLTLGDALHNMRAALDIAYVELLTLLGKTPTKWSTLRVFDDRDKLIDALTKGILQGEPDAVAMLADQVRAYVGGNALLEALDALDIDDKHRLLLPVYHVTRLEHVTAEGSIGRTNFQIEDCELAVGPSGVLKLIGAPGPGHVHVKDYGQPTFAVLFDQGTALEGQPIVETLRDLYAFASGVVDTFEAFVLARQATGRGGAST